MSDPYSSWRELETLTVHPPVMYGAQAADTWVGWRFKVVSGAGPEGGTQVDYVSPIQKDKANSLTAADGFSDMSYPFPYPPGIGSQAKIIMFWYKPGSKKKWKGSGGGKVAGRVEFYDLEWAGSNQGVETDFCKGDISL